MSGLRFLLVQIRKDPALLAPERAGFVELSGLADFQITTLDVYRQPRLTPAILDGYHALMIGGLSDDPSDSPLLHPGSFPFSKTFRI